MRDTVERSETRRHPQGGPGQTGRSPSRETTGEPRRSESIEVRTLAEHSDLIRIRMDRRLKDEFPALPRTQIDYFADQLDAGIRSAKSPQDARAIFGTLADLQTYVCVRLNNRTREELFSREIASRYSILKVKLAQP